MAQMMKPPENAFGKVNPADHTPESLRAFAQSVAVGKPDYSLLVPVRKHEFVDIVGPDGAVLKQRVNPYLAQGATPQGLAVPMPGFLGDLQRLGMLTPQMAADPRVQQVISGYIGKQSNQLSAKDFFDIQVKLAGLSNDGVRLRDETGTPGATVPGVPQTFNMFAQPGRAPAPQAVTPTSAPAVPPPSATPGPQVAPTQSTDPKPLIDTVVPKERRALLTAQPQHTISAKSALQNMERLTNVAQELKDHPGLSGIVGRFNQYSVTDLTDDAINARALQSTLVKQSAVNALQAMRDASKTGGAVGSVTKEEWPILEQQLAALDAAQTLDSYRTALTNLVNQLAAGSERVRSGYEQTYGALNFKSAPYEKQSDRRVSKGKIGTPPAGAVRRIK